MALVFCADCRKWLSFYREAGLTPRKIGDKEYEEWMEAFWKRKYESDFSNEMNRSMEVYLREFL